MPAQKGPQRGPVAPQALCKREVAVKAECGGPSLALGASPSIGPGGPDPAAVRVPSPPAPPQQISVRSLVDH